MRISSVSENKVLERRIAITPEIAKKYISLGLDVNLSENYAVSVPFSVSGCVVMSKRYSKCGV